MQIQPTLDQIRALPAVERLAVIADLVQVAEDARPLRDTAVREIRAEGGRTIDEIAAIARVSAATVKVILRSS